MKVYYELDLHHFEAWSGGKDTLNDLSYDEIGILNSIIEDVFTDDTKVSETTINDFLWFERDAIAEWLGYADYDSLLNIKKYGEEVTVKIFNVEWDIDEDEELTEMPTEIINTFEYNGNDDELEETISDWLSDEYGFCHNGFEYKIIENEG